MKIGTFAKKFNISISTIRFYMQNGLLVPTKKGGQYDFDEKCAKDMFKIIKYKDFRFSIEEMQHFFLLEDASNFKNSAVTQITSNLLKEKKMKLIDECNNLQRIINEIEQEVDKYPKKIEVEIKNKNIPFSIIPYLHCPYCKKPLELKNTKIKDGCIVEAILSCDNCKDYQASISNGIIFCKSHTINSPFKAFDNIDTLVSFSKESSSSYRSLILKAYVDMYNFHTSSFSEKRTIMAGPFTFNFLLTYINKINPKSTIIICDPSINKINKLKLYLSDCPHNIIYIAGLPKDLPLKEHSIDMYIDDYSLTDYCFTFNDFPIENIVNYLKPESQILGIFTDYSKAPETLKYFVSKNKDFEPEKMSLAKIKNIWNKNNMKKIEQFNIGKTPINEEFYPKSAQGEEISIFTYYRNK